MNFSLSLSLFLLIFPQCSIRPEVNQIMINFFFSNCLPCTWGYLQLWFQYLCRILYNFSWIINWHLTCRIAFARSRCLIWPWFSNDFLRAAFCEIKINVFNHNLIFSNAWMRYLHVHTHQLGLTSPTFVCVFSPISHTYNSSGLTYNSNSVHGQLKGDQPTDGRPILCQYPR